MQVLTFRSFPVLLIVVVGICLVGTASYAANESVNLLPNGGFEKGTLQALPGWERMPSGHGRQLDESERHAGERSLRVSAPGGMKTTLLPYTGGRVRIEGWMKTENIVRGSRPYYKATFQLISSHA